MRYVGLLTFCYSILKVLSSTSDKKSKTYVVLKRNKCLVRHNQLTDEIPVSIIFKVP